MFLPNVVLLLDIPTLLAMIKIVLDLLWTVLTAA